MKKVQLKFTSVLIVVFTALALLPSCKKDTSASCKNVFCTDIFAAVGVHVLDNSGNPVTLDDYYTVRNTTGEIIRNTGEKDGLYIVLSDGYVSKLYNTTASFIFVGIKGGKKVVNSSFIISADCCHVRKVSGEDTVLVK